jgi:hypothetical protein
MTKGYNWSCLILYIFFCACQNQDSSSPSKGQWDFELKKIWEIKASEQHPFDRIAEPLVTEDGLLYIRDFKNNVSYIFNAEGTFTGKFAQHGTNPGEITRYINRFCADETIVIGSPDKLHFFSKDGTYIKSYANNLFQRFPILFLNENEFLYGSNQMSDLPSHLSRIYQFNLSTNEEKIVDEFSVSHTDTTIEKSSGIMLFIHGLTPSVVLGYDEKIQRFYYGRNDVYQIHVQTLKGEKRRTFGLDREKIVISREEKRNHFKKSNWPEDRIQTVIDGLPNKSTLFHRIQAVNGLIYVWHVHGLPKNQHSQQIDIFSPEGNYLYLADFKFEDGITFSTVDQLVLNGNHLIGIFEDENGKSRIIKFKVHLPQA